LACYQMQKEWESMSLKPRTFIHSMVNRVFQWAKVNNIHMMETKELKLALLSGTFTRDEALELLTQLIAVKVRFHEAKIKTSSNEEDIKMREKRISRLQRDLFEYRLALKDLNKVNLRADIAINENFR
jgi:hypothetical protein